MKFRFLALALIGILGLARVQAYVTALNSQGLPNQWQFVNLHFQVPQNSLNRATRAIRYFLHDEAFSEANREAELNAVRAAFGQWQSIPDTTIRFEDAGLITGAVDINTQDTTNVVFWAKSSTLVNNEMTDIRFTLGVSFRSGLVGTQVIAESDIVFNGVENDWFTDFDDKNNPGQFIEGIAIHEIGHLLGLEHSTVGGSTMVFDSGGAGINTVVGLSSDDIIYGDAAYGQAAKQAIRGGIRGVVTKNGVGVYGANVVVEDQTGAIITGTVTRQASVLGPEGHFEIDGVPAGDYHLRVLPMDPSSADFWLLIPEAIPLPNPGDVDTNFQISANIPFSVSVRQNTTVNVAVEEGDVPFRITGIRGTTTNGFSFTLLRSAVSLNPGDENFVFGVYGPDLPSSGGALSITGPGIVTTPTQTEANLFPDLVHLFALVSVAEDAPPGLRTLVVRDGTDAAYAAGYLEILPRVIDYDWSGLDDAFQREFFDPFTNPDAGPEADPDGDGFVNAEEADAGSDPTDPNSIPNPTPMVTPFRLLSVNLGAGGSTLTFESVEGAQYQLFSRTDLTTGDWTPVGAPTTATGTTTTLVDPTIMEATEFYRVESLP